MGFCGGRGLRTLGPRKLREVVMALLWKEEGLALCMRVLLHSWVGFDRCFSTEAMMEARVVDILNAMEPLAYRKMDFEEFCAAAISTHQLEALEGWEQIASTAF